MDCRGRGLLYCSHGPGEDKNFPINLENYVVELLKANLYLRLD